MTNSTGYKNVTHTQQARYLTGRYIGRIREKGISANTESCNTPYIAALRLNVLRKSYDLTPINLEQIKAREDYLDGLDSINSNYEPASNDINNDSCPLPTEVDDVDGNFDIDEDESNYVMDDFGCIRHISESEHHNPKAPKVDDFIKPKVVESSVVFDRKSQSWIEFNRKVDYDLPFERSGYFAPSSSSIPDISAKELLARYTWLEKLLEECIGRMDELESRLPNRPVEYET
jgi:hypothetical protein